jgi:hypothetical protein
MAWLDALSVSTAACGMWLATALTEAAAGRSLTEERLSVAQGFEQGALTADNALDMST